MTEPSLPPSSGPPAASGGHTDPGASGADPATERPPDASRDGAGDGAGGGPGDGPGDTSQRRNRRRWIWGIGLVLLTAAVLGAIFVPTPYVLIKPGAVRPAEPRVTVDGAKDYEDDGAVLFTTVFVDDATLFGLVRGALDDAIAVQDRDEVYGDRGRDVTRRINQQAMDRSKLVAEFEALSYLGYDAEFTAEGVRVRDVDEDAPAGGEIVPGDVITSVDGRTVSTPSDLRNALEPLSPGDTVTLGISRVSVTHGESALSGDEATATLDVKVELTSAAELGYDSSEGDGDGSEGQDSEGSGADGAAETARAVLGVIVEPYNPRVESDVDVAIDSGEVTGPSAGLAWSLAVIDVLTPGSLTGHRDIAVTGEILADGRVGIIGGTAQKTATVVRNGIDVFMYPAGTPAEEQAEMRDIAGDEVELVPVATLDEAVDYLKAS